MYPVSLNVNERIVELVPDLFTHTHKVKLIEWLG